MKINIKDSLTSCYAAEDETILLACARAGIIITAPCGGNRRCGKCKVQILEGQIKGDTPDSEGKVLACYAKPVTDILIAIDDNLRILTNEVFADNKSYEPVNVQIKRAGVAIDIGTTTISARLLDLDSSQVLDTVSELNKQQVFGSDVISRIGAAINGKTQELFNLINRQTENILSYFIGRWNIPLEKLSVSGNTVMLHLFLNVDPSSMGMLPFSPVFLEEKELKGEELSLPVKTVSILPSIAAFIGGDITAGLSIIDTKENPNPCLLIDIGTNGEMALIKGDAIYCCATAAGPAFEGAEISCGVGGIKGAISGVESVNNTSDLIITTIGGAAPIGVCGSGLIDAIAVMLKKNIIDETGFMEDEQGFILSQGISVSLPDIRQYQLAKSAILSGIKILFKNAELKLSEIKNVFIAGGFGFFINKKNAVNTGIFPKEFLDILSICGNLSLRGAEENLLDSNYIERCKKIIKRCQVIDLSMDPSFTDEFAENMLFY